MLARVYYMGTVPGDSVRSAALALVLLLGVLVADAGAQGPAFTLHPGLTKGPADAPVTIVEFADYQ